MEPSPTFAREHAWIPSKSVSAALLAAQETGHNPVRTFHASVLLNRSMENPLRSLVQKYLGDSEALKRAAEISVTEETVEGLQRLISMNNLRASVDLAAKILENLGYGFGSIINETLFSFLAAKVWNHRLQCLHQLGEYSAAFAEMQQFGDLDMPDLYHNYSSENCWGSIVPFSFRLLHADLPQFCSKPNLSIARLYYLKQIIALMLENLKRGLNESGQAGGNPPETEDSVKYWQHQSLIVDSHSANCYLRLNEFRIAFCIYEDIPSDYFHILTADQKATFYLSLCRLFLKAGDQKHAASILSKIENIEDFPSDKCARYRSLMRAYMAMFVGNYGEAYDEFSKVRQLAPENIEAVNNAAVCLVYKGHLRAAISLLEEIIQQNLKLALHEDIILNLCTLYELSSARSLHKKTNLLTLVHNHCGDLFDVKALKLEI